MQDGGRGIRVVIADSQPVYRDGLLQSVSRDGFAVVAVCDDGQAALAALTTTNPGVLLAATDLEYLDGLQLARATQQLELRTRVILISTDPDAAILYDALAAGAAGFLSKRSSAGEIRAAIRTVAEGGTVLGPDLHGGIAHEIRIRRGTKPVLSEREREVLRHVARGQTARQIASELFIGAATVRTHLHNAYEKLDVRDKSSAVAEAMRRGVLT
jgi:two-component system, NarL family, nitrate/nitrite response regulator NarL